MRPLASSCPALPGALPVRRFLSHAQASAALVASVAADLDRAVARHGAASLAVPGGGTPGDFLSLLGYRTLDWPRIHITLTDERWVPASHERSNAGLLTRTLGRHERPYRWFPLWRPDLSPDAAAEIFERESASLPWPLDVVVLGMGDDGHVASLFPGDPAGFDAPAARRFVAVRGPGDEPRISLTAAALAQARAAYLLIRGQDKEAVLNAALGGDLPVARLLAARQGSLIVYSSA